MFGKCVPLSNSQALKLCWSVNSSEKSSFNSACIRGALAGLPSQNLFFELFDSQVANVPTDKEVTIAGELRFPRSGNERSPF